MPSSTRPSATTMSKAAAAPCLILPRPVDVHVARGLRHTTFAGVIDITSSASETLKWCMSVHLVPSSLLCPKCAKDMSLDVQRERWRCARVSCRTERSVRTGSFFGKSKLPLRKLVRLICHWEARTPVTKVAEMVGINEQAALQRGRRFPDCWLFGGVDRTTNRWFGILTYDDRTKPTLSILIKKHIKAANDCSTTIMSDRFVSYVSANTHLLRGMNFKHLWVNHSETYMDPVTGAHTNRVEGA
ncbi:hypothetical protein PC129_g10229 [Phytophthora cactorum]|uniref:ISXO2-like transposase domain-containing protein n=2 Tax=Phytophthora cactorum TaxID=29920 RepID=A0A8T1D353_9STRA|nr:hypothetical protein PC114_g15920 [Phytophthora cactorum]KAG2934878.1 hypothetical protein PC117_g12554 [Phytophthora cactorum]KAG3070244.1 hypothetical protein PC122_g16220 [Phytophthora cactorum]KAG3145813.1 hypothetical protein C6341_g18252 [Phytophthora cactorum]KAG3218964.1 hypothetical protein PC129_g10229 [Phytophthora cactorum]